MVLQTQAQSLQSHGKMIQEVGAGEMREAASARHECVREMIVGVMQTSAFESSNYDCASSSLFDLAIALERS